MNKVLVYYGKHENIYWLVDTPERRVKAFSELFKILDEMGCYDDEVPNIESARNGDSRAIIRVLQDHQVYEYEEWHLKPIHIL